MFDYVYFYGFLGFIGVFYFGKTRKDIDILIKRLEDCSLLQGKIDLKCILILLIFMCCRFTIGKYLKTKMQEDLCG